MILLRTAKRVCDAVTHRAITFEKIIRNIQFNLENNSCVTLSEELQ
jgi:hypothetical protein